jgi:hypothetical protein
MEPFNSQMLYPAGGAQNLCSYLAGRIGSFPRLATFEGLRSAARADLGSAYLQLGINLDRLTLLRAKLSVNRTRPAPNRVYLRETPIWLPSKLRDLKAPFQTMPLSYIVTEWKQEPAINLTNWRKRACFYAHVGLDDGMSYPDIPPGSFLQIDDTHKSIQGTTDSHYYFVRHPYGYSCCRCALENGIIYLLPSLYHYPQLTFRHPGVVEIVGRVRAFCARIDHIVPPPVLTLHHLHNHRTPMIRTPAELAKVPPIGSELLLNQRLCLGIPYNELDEATSLIHSFGSEFFTLHITGGHAHKIEHDPGFIPTIPTLGALTAYYGLDYAGVLKSYGFNVDGISNRQTSLENPNRQDSPLTPNTAHLGNEFLNYILDQWLEWPALLSQLLSDLPNQRIFFFAGNSGIEPILKPASFLLVDDSDSIADASSWNLRCGLERPLYLLYLRETGFTAGYAIRERKWIHILAHERASDRRTRTFVYPEGVDIVGRITGIATLI